METLKRRCCLLALLLASSPAVMAQPSQEALIRKLLVCIKAEERFTLSRDEAFVRGFNAAPSAAALPESLKQQIYALFQQTADEVFSWQVVQDRFIELYKNNFSSNELLSLKKLCSDPDYRVVVDADLRIIPDSLSIGFEFQPELQRRFQRRLEELLQQHPR
mgnify:CR=1 FL=1